MVTITFREFDSYINELEEFVKNQQIDLNNYWPTDEEFEYGIKYLSNNVLFFVLLNYIVENNKENKQSPVTKKDINVFLRNNLELIE